MDKVNIKISKKIYDEIEKRVDSGGFRSVEEFVNFVLEEVIKDIDGDSMPQDTDLSKEEEEKVLEKLRALGYL